MGCVVVLGRWLGWGIPLRHNLGRHGTAQPWCGTLRAGKQPPGITHCTPPHLPQSSLTGDDFYGAFDAQDTANKHAAELGMQTVPSRMVVYTEEHGYVYAEEAKEQGLNVLKLSGTQFRKMLRGGEDIPEWFAFKSVVSVLREAVAAESDSE